MEWVLIGVLAVLALAIIIGVIYGKNNERTEWDTDTSVPNYDEQQAKRYGDIGEQKVSIMLNVIANKYSGKVYNKFCLEDDQGFSSEIDHILVTIGGVFIIETKNNKGIVIGKENDDKWTCLKRIDQENKELNNPIKQNQGHINHLRKMFKKNPPKMISVIVFPEADLSFLKIDKVYSMESAKAYIESCIQESIHKHQYSQEFVERILAQLNEIKEIYGISEEKHKQNTQKYHRKSEQ